MKKKFDYVYQFKITLQDTKPPIWRRIQVPETYTFYDLHVAIQDAMGGYEDFIKIIKNPKHKEYEDMLEWAGGEFDPEHFDPEEVMFDDPAKRRKMAME